MTNLVVVLVLESKALTLVLKGCCCIIKIKDLKIKYNVMGEIGWPCNKLHFKSFITAL